MRYIRTKKGNVYKTIGKSDYSYFVSDPNFYADMKNIYFNEIEEESDTIEELCDCFVRFRSEFYDIDCVTIGCRNAFVGIYKRLAKAKKGLKQDYSEILYGAIWTSKGLIYVAKTNEKGEFELL